MAQVQALQNGETRLFAPQVTADVVAAAEKIHGRRDQDRLREHLRAHGPRAEQQRARSTPPAYGGDAEKALLVRQAFLHAVPRNEIVEKLIKPIDPDAEVRNSFLRTPGTAGLRRDRRAATAPSEYAKTDPTLSK